MMGPLVVALALCVGSATILAGGGLNEDPNAREGDGKQVGAASGNLPGMESGNSDNEHVEVVAFGMGDKDDFARPLPGLTPDQLALFEEGLAEFQRELGTEDGLGPIFNDNNCASCHSLGGIGGAGVKKVERFGRLIGKGEFDPMADFGGSLLQSSVINNMDECQEVIPDEATVTALRITTPTFGTGLMEAIADETILALEDPTDADGDGISGRAHIVMDPIEGVERVGRFGWKAQVATLDTFSADAQKEETGVTNIVFMQDNDPNGVHPPALGDCDMIEDPEDVPDMNGISNFNRMANFQRFLAPVPRLPSLNNRGFFLFRQIGCADCHTPVLFTAPNEVAALSNKPVFLFSDMLLHDMGALGDQIVQGDAQGFEMKTAPLWGVRLRPQLLHDGRARDTDDMSKYDAAIMEHGGEAAASRDAYLRLKTRQRAAVRKFLDSI